MRAVDAIRKAAQTGRIGDGKIFVSNIEEAVRILLDALGTLPQVKYLPIDTPERRELIAAQKSVEEIRAYVGADSIGYLSEPGMLGCLETPAAHFCTACFSGNYRVLDDNGIGIVAKEER